jgi:hypothetical protein
MAITRLEIQGNWRVGFVRRGVTARCSRHMAGDGALIVPRHPMGQSISSRSLLLANPVVVTEDPSTLGILRHTRRKSY